MPTAYYFADNYNSEGHANVQVGNDTYDGLAPTFVSGTNGPKRTTTGFNFENKAAGDQFRFCVGGRWHITTGRIVLCETNPNATADNPLIFNSYDQGVGASGKPWLSSSAGGTTEMFYFGSAGGGQAAHGGFTIDGLELDGGSGHACYGGIVFYASVRNFTVQNCKIHHMAQVGLRSTPYEVGSYINTFGLILDNEIYQCLFTGWLGSCTDFLMEGNNFHHNGSDDGLNHGIYYGAGPIESTRQVIRHNIVRDNNTRAGVAAGGHLTFRGKLRYTTVENNLVENTTGAYSGANYAISHFAGYSQNEYHYDTVIRGNRVINLPVGIIVGNTIDCIVENNLVYDNTTGQSSVQTGVLVDSSRGAADDAVQTRPTVRNNTIIYSAARSLAIGISASAAGAGRNCDDVNINNNAIVFVSIVSGTPSAFSLSETNVTYANINNNFVGGALSDWHVSRTSLASFEAYYDALGATVCNSNAANATHGLTTPTSGNSWNAVPTSGSSPVVNTASETLGTKLAIDGYAREASYDIGAFEYGRNP